jgi:tripartite ATP-independent transporter DctM subunit
MPEWFVLLAVFGAFLLLLGAGMLVPFAIAVPALLYLVMHGGIDALRGLGLTSWGSTNSFTLTSIPLFILMAELLQASGLSHRIYRGLSKLVAMLPGGLLQTNIAGCALFAAISGSSVATAAAIGTSALPQLTARNYDRRLSAGSLAAGGTLGILIPPSIAMIVYGTFTETSIAKLFMAGVVPGLLLTGMFMAYIGIVAWLNPAIAPREPAPKDAAGYAQAAIDLLPFVLLIGGTMGSLYLGIVTPTEAAAVGCVLAWLVGMIWGDLPWRTVGAAMRATVLTCGNILFIVYAAFIFSYAISLGGVGETLTGAIAAMDLSRWQFFLALVLLYTVLGCLVESLGMIVITVPLLYPVLLKYGIDPIWFGIMLVLFIEMGQISPPLGINLFVIQSIWDGKLSDVVIGTIPFHLIMFVLVALLAIWPEIALWLPQQMTVRPG